MIGLLINLCCSYIYTLNLVVFYIYFHIFTALYFSFIQKVSATHAPTHYLWFLQQRHRQKPGWALNRLSCVTVHTHCKQKNELKSVLCCGDSHFILDNILVNISASPVTSLCVSLPVQAYYCKAKASLQTCTRCANNATWHCCSYSWRTEKKKICNSITCSQIKTQGNACSVDQSPDLLGQPSWADKHCKSVCISSTRTLMCDEPPNFESSWSLKLGICWGLDRRGDKKVLLLVFRAADSGLTG